MFTVASEHADSSVAKKIHSLTIPAYAQTLFGLHCATERHLPLLRERREPATYAKRGRRTSVI